MAIQCRKKPYTEKGMIRVKCARCGQPSIYQWNCCAKNNFWMGLCKDCDIKLNRLVLNFVNDPNKKALIKKYIIKIKEGE